MPDKEKVERVSAMPSFRSFKMLFLPVSLVVAASLFAVPTYRAGSTASDCDPDPLPPQADIFHYRMKGKVRLLFFWVGKDDVGGGHIALMRKDAPAGRSWSEGIQVLFGSNPDRVPGRVNRWGFATEWSYWRGGPLKPASPFLEETVFEGFMRHSKEDSVSQVIDNASRDESRQIYLYDGIQSTVQPRRAHSEIRVFSQDHDFDFRQPDRVKCSYRNRLDAGPPDKKRSLHNEKDLYRQPYGFLTAVRAAVRTVMDRYQADPSGQQWQKVRPRLTYVYNAKIYQLVVRDLDLQKTFRMESSEEDPRQEFRDTVFQNVVEASFRLSNSQEDYHHDFSIWFPMQGRLRGVPLRIVDKPRWWLRVELTLDEARLAPRRAENDRAPVEAVTNGGVSP